MRSLIVALTLAVALSGCASTSTTLQVTGESIVGLGTQFDAVSRHMTAACVAKTYTVATCTTYRTFGEKFKLAYPAAKTLWHAATQFEDKGLASAAQASLAKLSADLAPFVAMMGGK
jgi:hypothetical protein